MAVYKNFYETVKEAQMRLNTTVVLYDGKPHYVIAVEDHKEDGIYRVYLDPTFHDDGLTIHNIMVPHDGPPGDVPRGKILDDWMDSPIAEKSRIIRKKINSPLFDKFRPFPLGMVNQGGYTLYTERQSVRHTHQGLTSSMVKTSLLSLEPTGRKNAGAIDPSSKYLARTIMNDYPSFEECIENLKDPEVTNTAVAFDRNFALIRGPLQTMFLAYKSDTVGMLMNGDKSKLRLAPKFSYTKEVTQNLNIFNELVIQ